VVGRAARVPTIVAHEHSWSYEGQPVRRFVDREVIARGCDLFLTVSEEDRRRMIEIERIDPAQIRFLPIGITPRGPSGRDLRRELGIGPDAPVLGALGHLRPQKAHEVLFSAVATLMPRFPSLRVLVAGGGSEEERLHALVAELGLTEVVTFVGTLDAEEVPDFLAAVDVSVNSSDFEGTPAALIEAMAAARPVVATRVGGTPALIDDGVHGYLVPPRDPGALADAVARLLEDPDLRAELGRRGRERQQLEFDFDAMVRRLEAIYDELASRRRGVETPRGTL
jgi:glycosyltransferase involved in cell wall biosynthesis